MTLPFEDIFQVPDSAPSGVDVLGTSNRSVDSARWAIVLVFIEADPGSTSSASVNVDADLDDDGTEEHIGQSFAQGGLNSLRRSTITFPLPPGATYSVRNTSDPDTGNMATAWEFTF